MKRTLGQWITDDQRFCFDFYLNSGDPLEVETTIFYTSLISDKRVFQWEETLCLGKVYELDASQNTDGYILRGSIFLKISNTDRDEPIVVWANIQYGKFSDLSNFQGPIFILGETNHHHHHHHDHHDHHDDKHFHEHEEPDKQNPATIIEPERNHDLFPYTYMRAWPSITDEERYFNFIETPEDLLSENSFYQKLVTLKAQGNANAMIQAAVDFINSDQFVGEYGDLTPMVARYNALHHHLTHHWDQSDIVAYCCEFLDLQSAEELETSLTTTDYIEFINRIWLSFIAMMVCAGYKFRWLDELITIIIINNLLSIIIKREVSNREVKQLLDATIVLPADIFPLPSLVPSPPPTDYNVLPYAIGELQIVRQKLIGYKTGEIARIINILPGEKKKVTNRTRESEKKHSATKSNNTEMNAEKTQETSEDFESEIIKTFANYTKNHDYTGLNTNYGPPYAVTIGGTKKITKTFDNPSKKDISEFAKKILNTSSQNLSKKIVEWRSHSTHRETEEKNVSVFDNSKSKKPITAYYKWLNKVYEARVVNYGKRLIYTLWILDPALGYKKTESYNKGRNDYRPKSPDTFGIIDYESITLQNSTTASLYYEIEIPNYPPTKKTVSAALNEAESLTVQIPDGYKASNAVVTYALPQSGETILSGAIGQKTFMADHPASNTITLTMNGETDSLPIVVTSESTMLSPPESSGFGKVNIEIECVPTTYTVINWQISTYRAITNAYQRLENEYYDKFSDDILDGNYNPERSETIIKNEIKKISSYTIGQYQSTQSSSVLSSSLSPPENNLEQPILYQFINSIFEWSEMTFQFYENLGGKGNPDHWIGVSSNEDLYTTFLKAGAVRVMLPVIPKYSRHAILFMDTGTVWEGKDDMIPSTDQNVNLMYEAKTIEPDQDEIVEDQWQVIVPTSQQIVDQYINLITNRDERI